MGAQAIDYRISRVVVCCKDCGQDVGLYPARHKCQDVIRPPLPPLPTTFGDDLKVPRKPCSPSDNDNRSRSTSATTSSATLTNSNNLSDTPVISSGSKWARFGRSNTNTPPSAPSNNNPTGDENEESIYFNNFAAHLPEGDSTPTGVAGKKLWGKVRQNDKWKQINEKYEKPKQSTKLWGKLIQATQNMAEKMPAHDDHGPDSDESDWEGESHVSRILREHYERKHERLPNWLFDEHTPVQAKTQAAAVHSQDPPQEDMGRMGHSTSLRGRKQRLWESSEPKMTQREREREELRQQRHVQNTTPPGSMDAPEERGRYNKSYSDENPRYARSSGRQDDQYQRPPPGSGGRYDDHQRSSPSSGRYDDYQRTPSSGGRYDDYQRAPPSGGNKYDDYQRSPPSNGGRYDDYQRSPPSSGSRYEDYQRSPPTSGGRSRYSGYEADGNDSNPYLSERRAPPMRPRSPARPYSEDVVSDYFSDNHRYDERARGPREIPSHGRRTERAGGYF